MRNSSEAGRDTWAAYVKAAREAARLNKSNLARRLGVDRATISRWEAGATRPDSADAVAAFADLFSLDRDEALQAAGFRPGSGPPPERPTRHPDPVIQVILENNRLSKREKDALIGREQQRIEADQRRRREELDWYLSQRPTEGEDTA